MGRSQFSIFRALRMMDRINLELFLMHVLRVTILYLEKLDKINIITYTYTCNYIYLFLIVIRCIVIIIIIIIIILDRKNLKYITKLFVIEV